MKQAISQKQSVSPIRGKSPRSRPIGPTPTSTNLNSAAGTQIRVMLFDSGGSDRTIDDLNELAGFRPSVKQLLWVDVQGADRTGLKQIGDLLRLPEDAVATMNSAEAIPLLRNGGEFFWLRVVAVDCDEGLKFDDGVLTLLAGSNIVVSCHAEPIGFIEQFRLREAGETDIGRLTSASFITALLDWQLSSYFEAVTQFETAVDHLEVEVLSAQPRDCISELRKLRKAAARLRRMLAPHHVVFAGLQRPDFRPQEDGRTDQHFLALNERFERAMDTVENARELVVGTFELFTSQNALSTNKQMRILTFVTVVIGGLAALAGAFGMNFKAPFFETATHGFWWVIGAMLGSVVLATLVGRAKKWF